MTLASLATLDRDLPPEVPGYDLGTFLGRGASGSVWSARATAGGDEVAIKLCSPAGSDAPGEGARELDVAALVTSEHVVRARERLVLPDGGVAVVLDLADGGSLHDVIALRGTLPVGEVVTVVAPLATALAHLHRAGIVHADVSPGNVLFTISGKPMLADLTSARLPGDTESNPPVGTTGFTAPEVLAGDAQRGQ
ncbi:MAG: protein kinase [Actinomycetota bacterium]|nr:protein kinase [Actinomycetota bacterium]